MDGVVISLFCVVMFIIYRPTAATPEEQAMAEATSQVVQLNPHLNPSMYHDEQAFMLIANELGFH